MEIERVNLHSPTGLSHVAQRQELGSPVATGNQSEDGVTTVAGRFRSPANQASWARALAASRSKVDDVRTKSRFFEEVRVRVAKFETEARASGRWPVPEECQGLAITVLPWDGEPSADGPSGDV